MNETCLWYEGVMTQSGSVKHNPSIEIDKMIDGRKFFKSVIKYYRSKLEASDDIDERCDIYKGLINFIWIIFQSARHKTNRDSLLAIMGELHDEVRDENDITDDDIRYNLNKIMDAIDGKYYYMIASDRVMEDIAESPNKDNTAIMCNTGITVNIANARLPDYLHNL